MNDDLSLALEKKNMGNQEMGHCEINIKELWTTVKQRFIKAKSKLGMHMESSPWKRDGLLLNTHLALLSLLSPIKEYTTTLHYLLLRVIQIMVK